MVFSKSKRFRRRLLIVIFVDLLAVQEIEQLGVFKKHRFFITAACNGVVYVRKFIALGVFVLANLKDAVIKDCLNGDDILPLARQIAPCPA